MEKERRVPPRGSAEEAGIRACDSDKALQCRCGLYNGMRVLCGAIRSNATVALPVPKTLARYGTTPCHRMACDTEKRLIEKIE